MLLSVRGIPLSQPAGLIQEDLLISSYSSVGTQALTAVRAANPVPVLVLLSPLHQAHLRLQLQ